MTTPRGQFEKPQAVLRAVLESPQGIVIFALDRDYRYLAFNENHARTIQSIWGGTVEVGVSMLGLITREDDRRRAQANFDRALAGESFTIHEAYGNEHLERRFYENAYSPIRDEDQNVIGLTVYLTDITERKRAELELRSYRTRLEELVELRTQELESAHAQLLHVQKLESLGVLAGGVAHDFNNLLAVILGRAELAVASVAPDCAARAHLAIVQETALEARMLTKQLLGYSGKGKFMVQLVDLNQLVESMMQLLRASISRGISLQLEHQEQPQLVEADTTQLRQVVLNLVTNAAEAIGDQGSVIIRARTIEVDQAYLTRTRAQPQIATGSYVALEVQDSGCGMDERVRSKLFDPFFTTKFAGRGLGLAAVLGIVSGHRGSIAVTTAVGKGSTFAVLLPSAGPGREAPKPRSTPPAPASVKSGIVLVIDDERAVRSMTSVSLQSAGHEVLAAAGGIEGVKLFELHRERIELVLLDLTMPEMNGEQTLRELQAIDPKVSVVVMTGYAEDDVHERFEPNELAGFLAKPFARDELFGAVDAALRRVRRARENESQ